MWLIVLINFLQLFDTINCFPSIPGSIENAIVLRRLTKLYTLRSNAKLSDLCEGQSKIYNKALSNGSAWALEMMDASSKLQAGIAGWNIADLGNFDQCLAIDNNDNKIKGKLCYTRIKYTQNQMSSKMLNLENHKRRLLRNLRIVQPRDMTSDMLDLRWSFCVPNDCSAKDVQVHLNKFFTSNENGTLFTIKETDCQTFESQPKLTAGDWTVIGFLIAIGCIVILSTIYDVILYYFNKESAHPLLVAFSWFTNFRKFIKFNNNPDQLPCLNGIRFISMIWIIHGHQFDSATSGVIVNLKKAFEWLSSFWGMCTLSSSVSVDTFFLLSGCLLMYGFLKSKIKNSPCNIPMMYLHRYLRLTPMYAVTIIFCMTLYTHMGSGVTWPPSTEKDIENCKKYWWSALLYVQNFVNPNEMCIPQSWYLQIDMQLFVVSPLILYFVYKFPKLVPYTFGVLIIIFTAIPMVITWQNDLDPVMIGNNDGIYYANTFARAGPWIVGLALGYILFYRDQNKYQINMTSNSFLWIGSLSVLSYIMFGNYHALKHGYYKNQIFDIVFMGFHRNVWAIFVGLIIFACVQGYGGPVNWFLSLPVFQVLGRLTYSMYCTHLMLIQIILPRRTYIFFSYLNMTLLACGTVGLDLIISLVCLLTFETPFAVIDNVLLGGLAKLLSKKPKTKDKAEPKVEA